MSDSIIIAVIGVIGAIIGSAATVAAQCVAAYIQEQRICAKNKPRKELLMAMLSSKDHEWRNLKTLMHVIGSDEETTKNLLLEIGARASENGQELWGLITRNPLPKSTQ